MIGQCLALGACTPHPTPSHPTSHPKSPHLEPRPQPNLPPPPPQLTLPPPPQSPFQTPSPIAPPRTNPPPPPPLGGLRPKVCGGDGWCPNPRSRSSCALAQPQPELCKQRCTPYAPSATALAAPQPRYHSLLGDVCKGHGLPGGAQLVCGVSQRCVSVGERECSGSQHRSSGCVVGSPGCWVTLWGEGGPSCALAVRLWFTLSSSHVSEES